MEEIINIREIYGEDSLEIKILEALVMASIFDSVEEVREAAVKGIEKAYGGIICSGFATSEKVFVDLCYNGEIKTGYVCEKPEKYLGKPSETHPFKLASETIWKKESEAVIN